MTLRTTPSAGSIVTRWFGLGVLVLLAFVGACSAGSIVENVDSDEIVVIQGAWDGELHWYTTAGVKTQLFGKVTTYHKRQQFAFEQQVRFNDGGHGTIIGSIQWEMPLDTENLTMLHNKYGSDQAIASELVSKAVSKAIYMTGPLMSSTESYAAKRNYLINYVEDQIQNGVFKTIQRETRVKDELTGQEKTAIVVDIVQENGRPARQEQSALAEFGIKTFNFSIDNLPYDGKVEEQIAAQQKITMQVQTAIAEARQAEQRKLTVEQQGAAAAAQAKWEQEVIKAKMVTEAQQKLEVQQLDTKTAESYKQATLLRAEADAAARQKMMQADGALEKKLAAYVQVQANYAQALANMKVPIVPSTVMGGSGTTGNNVQSFIDLQTMKAMKDLGIDPTPGRQ